MPTAYFAEKVSNSRPIYGLLPPLGMTWDIRTRVRQRIARLLEDRGFTNRLYAKKVDHREQWVSNLLNGKFTPKLDELDKLAAPLGVPASELVRHAEDLWELNPTEMRVIRAVRQLPPAVRDHLVTLADYLMGVTPDEIDLIRRIRALEGADRVVIEKWLEVRLRLPDIQPNAVRPADTLSVATPPAGRSRRPRVVPPKTPQKTPPPPREP